MSHYPRYGDSDRDRSSRGSFHDKRRDGGWSRRESYRPYRSRDDNYGRRDIPRYRRDWGEVERVRRDRDREREEEITKDNDSTFQRSFHNVTPHLVKRSPGPRSSSPPSAAQSHSRGGFIPNFRVAPAINGDDTRCRSIYNDSIPLPPAPPPPPPPPPPNSAPKLTPAQQQIIDTCITNLKTRGDYDRIRHDCMLDIDTKPAFQNALEKVKDITKRFLQTAKYHPSMDKARVRENLKKSFEISPTYQNGIESLVNQVLIPRIASVLRPMVESEIKNVSNGGMPGTGTAVATNSQQKQFNSQIEPQIAVNSKVYDSSVQAPSETVSRFSPATNKILDQNLNLQKVKWKPVISSSWENSEESTTQTGTPSPPQSKPDLLQTQSEEIQSQLIDHSSAHLEAMLPEKGSIISPAAKIANEDSVTDVVKSDNEIQNQDINEPLDMNQNSFDNCNQEGIQLAWNGDMEKQINNNNNNEAVNMLPVSDEVAVKNELGESNLQNGETGHEDIEMCEDITECEDDEDVIEEDSDEESPAFEKIEEVSPVRIEPVPDYEIKYFTTFESGENVGNTNESGSNKAEASQQNLCKFLEFDDKASHDHKMMFYKRLGEISPSKGRTSIKRKA